jgi:hypothetical protein
MTEPLYGLMRPENISEVLEGLEHSDGCVSQKIKISDLVLSARSARLVGLLTTLFMELLESGMSDEELIACVEEVAIAFEWDRSLPKLDLWKGKQQEPNPTDEAA